MVNLTTLAPEIVEPILDVALPVHLTLFDLAVYQPRFGRSSGYGFGEAETVKG